MLQQVVVFLVSQKYDFSAEDICKSMIGIWNYFSYEKKKAICNAVKRIMRELSSKNYCKDWLTYNPPNFSVNSLSKSALAKFTRAVQVDTSLLDELPFDFVEEELS
ncbi:MAG: hypothetical protein WBA43_18875 [Elainellaceae cyanobacterium]